MSGGSGVSATSRSGSRREAELREQSEWFRVTLGSIGDAVITVDNDCRVTFLNPVAEELTGWTDAPRPSAGRSTKSCT